MYRTLILLLLSGSIEAHEFTPTYPILKQSYIKDVLYTTMTLFNARNDVNYYELGVFDENWEKVPFAVQQKVMNIKHLERKKIDVYIKKGDKSRVRYICSISKLLVTGEAKTSISSRICSKVK